MQSIKVKTTKKDGRIYAHVYKGVDKMPFKGTTFPLDTPKKTILKWANSPASEEISTF